MSTDYLSLVGDAYCGNDISRRSPRPVIEAPKSIVKVRSPAQDEVFNPGDTYGDCKKEQAGQQSCRENNSVIVQCDLADYKWREIGKCLGGYHCCQAKRSNPLAVECLC